MTKEKGRLSARGLDENVVQAFREKVKERYGKLHTVFGLELQKAMEAYLEVDYTHTPKKESPPKNVNSIGELRLNRLDEELKSLGFLTAINNGGSIYENTVKKVMRKSVGLDARTISKYFQAFCDKNDLEVNTNGELIKL
jgi:hypothetical protein